MCRDCQSDDSMAETGQAVLIACCNLLATLIRHRAKGLRRCMALLTASSRHLLQRLAAWLLQAGLHASTQASNGTLPGMSLPSPPVSQGGRDGIHADVSLQLGFKALGRVYSALAQEKVSPGCHLQLCQTTAQADLASLHKPFSNKLAKFCGQKSQLLVIVCDSWLISLLYDGLRCNMNHRTQSKEVADQFCLLICATDCLCASSQC